MTGTKFGLPNWCLVLDTVYILRKNLWLSLANLYEDIVYGF